MSRFIRLQQMRQVYNVLKFGWPFMKKYWVRFFLGIALGLGFAMSNGAFVGASYLLFNRIAPGAMGDGAAAEVSPSETTNKVTEGAEPEATAKPEEEEAPNEWAVWGNEIIDPWLPLTGREVDWRQILGGLCLLPLIALARGVMNYLSSYLLAWVGQHVVMDLKNVVFSKLTSLSMDFHNHSSSGDILIRINGDTNMLNSALSLGLNDLVKQPATLFFVFITLYLIDPYLTMFSVFFLPMCVIPTKLLGDKVRKASRQGVLAAGNINSVVVECFSNMRIVKAFGLEVQQMTEFSKSSRMINRMAMRMAQQKSLLNPIIEVFSAMGISVMIVFVMVSGGDVATLVVFAMSLGLLFAPIKKLGGIHLYFSQTAIGVERIGEVLAMEASVKENPDGMVVDGFNRRMRLHKINFSYDGKNKVLDDVSFDIEPGARIGLAGESGSGKSSLINLLFRFYDPTGGTIMYDGQNLRELNLTSYRSQLAMVSQDTLLFNVSIAENIGYGREGTTREEIVAAAKAARAHEFIEAQPNGYETLIGERGIRLSGGQRQRLAIARAFVRDAPLLVLDEATASLDSKTEAEVQEDIDRLSEDRTVVTVAHRLSTLRHCSCVYVLEEGRVIESGTFEELLLKEGRFADMAARQGIRPDGTVDETVS